MRPLFSLMLAASLIAGCILPEVRAPERPGDAAPGDLALTGPLLRVDVVDVGQGDAILVRSPAGKTLLFDAGPRVRAPELVHHLREAGVTRIDVLVLSHAHEDHYGGAALVAEAFPIGRAYEPGLQSDRAPWRATIQALEARNVSIFTSWTFAPGDRLPWETPLSMSPFFGPRASALRRSPPSRESSYASNTARSPCFSPATSTTPPSRTSLA